MKPIGGMAQNFKQFGSFNLKSKTLELHRVTRHIAIGIRFLVLTVRSQVGAVR